MIYLVEDDDDVRDAVTLYLQSKGHTVTGFADAASFLASLRTPPPECCVVSDVKMPGMSGLDLLRRLRTQAPDLPLILITGHGDIEMAVRAVKEGAHDFLEKPLNEARLLGAIADALAKRRNRSAAAVANEELLRRKGELTEREVEVMELAVMGKTNREIAEILGISSRTVEIHRSKVMSKMEAATLADLVRIVLSLKGPI